MKSQNSVCRKCVSCGSIVSKDSLIRIVRNKEGETSLDFTLNKEGRGAYICRSKECIEKAFKKKLLERSFRAGIDPEDRERLIKETDNFG